MEKRYFEIAEDCYKIIDQGLFNRLENIHSEKVVYVRGNEIIKGIGEYIDFYDIERRKKILSGKHKVWGFKGTDKGVRVFGTFEGKDRQGEELSMKFTDNFEFDASGRIVGRKTQIHD